MNIDSIQNGYVLDHIKAGASMEIYKLLGLDKLDCSVAIIKNAKSTKLSRKDIIKIDALIDLNLDVLGYVDPNITVSVIENGRLAKKIHPQLPEKLTNVLRCKNPRCITSSELQLPSEFLLTDPQKHTYRCAYCDTEYNR